MALLTTIDGTTWPVDGTSVDEGAAGNSDLFSFTGASATFETDIDGDRYIKLPISGGTQRFRMDQTTDTDDVYAIEFDLMFTLESTFATLPTNHQQQMISITSGGDGGGIANGTRLWVSIRYGTTSVAGGDKIRFFITPFANGTFTGGTAAGGATTGGLYEVPWSQRFRFKIVFDKVNDSMTLYANGIPFATQTGIEISLLDTTAAIGELTFFNTVDVETRIYASVDRPMISHDDADKAIRFVDSSIDREFDLHPMAQAGAWDIATTGTGTFDIVNYPTSGPIISRPRLLANGASTDTVSATLPNGTVQDIVVGDVGGKCLHQAGFFCPDGGSYQLTVKNPLDASIVTLLFDGTSGTSTTRGIVFNGTTLATQWDEDQRYEFILSFQKGETNLLLHTLSGDFSSSANWFGEKAGALPVPDSIGEVEQVVTIGSLATECEVDGLYMISEDSLLLASSFVAATNTTIAPNAVAPTHIANHLCHFDSSFRAIDCKEPITCLGSNPAGRVGLGMTDFDTNNGGIYAFARGIRFVWAEWIINDMDKATQAGAYSSMQTLFTAMESMITSVTNAGGKVFISGEAICTEEGSAPFKEYTRQAVRFVNQMAREESLEKDDVFFMNWERMQEGYHDTTLHIIDTDSVHPNLQGDQDIASTVQTSMTAGLAVEALVQGGGSIGRVRRSGHDR